MGLREGVVGRRRRRMEKEVECSGMEEGDGWWCSSEDSKREMK